MAKWRVKIILCASLLALILPLPAQTADFLSLRTNDVIVFVGGEDIAAMQNDGYLELLLTAAHPNLQLRFRCLAFEGDTVYEQRRQLNFPSWEKQLERVGATVVIAQFGQAESLQGTNTLPGFIAAYEALLDRWRKGDRRMVLFSPTRFEKPPGLLPDLTGRNADLRRYVEAIHQLARKLDVPFGDLSATISSETKGALTRDGLHLNARGHWLAARVAARQLDALPNRTSHPLDLTTGEIRPPAAEKLRQAILAKNRLWFDYWRPQNWAFLAGDRTEQPSSRDHRDPKKRWFPDEMEKFLPLIEAKEREIAELAVKLR